ncbi:MAG TPA: thymidine kinase [Chitinophagaceae bacterium]|jgi:thymidine kinase|nr:thymidine kinase [Chitinophagaceae bacterium]
MFIEPLTGEKRGWIEMISGSMFSGKTEELIRRLKRACIAHLRVEIFKPQMDTRFHEMHIVSHDENRIVSTPIAHAADILPYCANTDVVGIDEAQFFDEELPAVCDQLATRGIRVIVAGLDMDFKGNPFGPVPFLLAKADYITKLHAICVVCGNIASFSYRKTADQDKVLVGEKDLYEPRCRKCFFERP